MRVELKDAHGQVIADLSRAVTDVRYGDGRVVRLSLTVNAIGFESIADARAGKLTLWLDGQPARIMDLVAGARAPVFRIAIEARVEDN